MRDRPLRCVLGTTLGVVLAATLFSFVSAAEADAPGLRIAKDDSTVLIFDGPRLVLRYRYAGVPMKPYADQLFSPSGVQILRDSPHDHKHHHGLMYALAVDNVTLWEELPEAGRQMHKSLGGTKATACRAGFVEELEWVGPNSEKPLLVERRAIDVLKAADLGATLVEWRCRLQTPPGKEWIVITGYHYCGLGMRFVVSMDKGGFLFTGENKPSELVRGDERLTPVKWCAYTAKVEGKPVTVAIFDHPGNVRYPGKKFMKSKPFAYLSATLNEWKDPLTVNAGKPLDLRYGVALWDGEMDKAVVEKLYQRWLDLGKP